MGQSGGRREGGRGVGEGSGVKKNDSSKGSSSSLHL